MDIYLTQSGSKKTDHARHKTYMPPITKGRNSFLVDSPATKVKKSWFCQAFLSGMNGASAPAGAAR
jgi:hypothetical protein